MNIFIICFLGNHVSNALQNSDEKLLVSSHLEDSIHKSHQYKLNVSPNISPNMNEPDTSTFFSLLVNKNRCNKEPNEMNLKSNLLDYVISFIFKEFSKWHVEGDQNNSKNSDKDEEIIFISSKELEKAWSHDKKSKNEFVESNFFRNAYNDYTLDSINVYRKKEIEHSMVNSKVNREGKQNVENPTENNSSSLLGESRNYPLNKPLEKSVLNKDEGGINYSRKDSQNTFIADNLDFESLEFTQKVVSSEQDSDKVSYNRSISKKLKKGEHRIEHAIKIQSSSSSIKVQQLNYKSSFSFHPNVKLVLRNPDPYHNPSIIWRTLMPRAVVKRSLPSSSTRQFETPTEEHFPFSTAGSSLYGAYAYAHSRPSGIFSPFGGEGGEEGENGEDNEEGEENT